MVFVFLLSQHKLNLLQQLVDSRPMNSNMFQASFNIEEPPMLYTFSPDQFLNDFPLHTGVFDVDSWEATHCWSPLDPPLMIPTQAEVAAFMSCVTVAFLSLDSCCRWCPSSERWIICLIRGIWYCEETFKKINTWTFVTVFSLFYMHYVCFCI